MIRKVIMSGLLAAFLMVSTSVFAEDVVITKTGTKYHKEICRLVKNKTNDAMEKDDAIEHGFGPCKICFKEDALADDTNEKQVK